MSCAPPEIFYLKQAKFHPESEKKKEKYVLKRKLLWNNPSVHCDYILLSLDNKDADWPIIVKYYTQRDIHIEDTGIKKGRVRGYQSDSEGAGDEHANLIKIPSTGKA